MLMILCGRMKAGDDYFDTEKILRQDIEPWSWKSGKESGEVIYLELG